MADQDKDPIQLLVDTLAENQNQLARLLETTKTLSAKIEVLTAHQDKIGKTVAEQRTFVLSKEGAATLNNGFLEATKEDRAKVTAAAEKAIRDAGSSSVFTAGKALLDQMNDKLAPLTLASRQLQAMQEEYQRTRGDRRWKWFLIGASVLLAFIWGMIFDARMLRLDLQAWRIVHVAPICKNLGGLYLPPDEPNHLGGCWFEKPKNK